ncbi:MAG: hypothetical protein A4E35_01006 [Methanoregula sp. PtaU1.Bin051]|nr:MAG: hypothetical protein A4E35_01006 [Methanoregula sp. PtaU1.Bin051]
MSATDNETRSSRYEQESDRIRQFFIRPFFLSVTIGIPFCMYKFLCGIAAVRIGSPDSSLLVAAGWLVVAWAVVDLSMNAGRAVLDIAAKKAPFEYCMIAQLGQLLRMPMVFLALDTLLSFSIICFMLWSGWIATLTPAESYLWYGATTLNLISLSVVSLYNEIRKA